MKRKASAIWRGGLKDGKGAISTDSGVLKETQYSFGTRFENGVGTFYANDSWQGQPIRVRFLWTLPAPDRPRWEQAFSPDGGASWETNWIMSFTRDGA